MMKDKLLKKFDDSTIPNSNSKAMEAMDTLDNTTMDALFITRQVCGLTLAQSNAYDVETLIDMGRGTVEAMSPQDCMYVKWYCEKKGMEF